eukprot:scaffold186592_cov17-Tisochrysis_lutea.AAC.2
MQTLVDVQTCKTPVDRQICKLGHPDTDMQENSVANMFILPLSVHLGSQILPHENMHPAGVSLKGKRTVLLKTWDMLRTTGKYALNPGGREEEQQEGGMG